MKLRLFLILLSINTFSSFAQNSFSRNFFNYIEINSNVGKSEIIIHRVCDYGTVRTTKPGLSYGLNLMLGKELNQKWVIELGVQYQILKNNYKLEFPLSMLPFSAERNSVESFENISIPILIFVKPFNKLPLEFGFGVQASHFFRNTQSSSDFETTSTDISYQDVSVISSVRYNIQLHKQLNFLIGANGMLSVYGIDQDRNWYRSPTFINVSSLVGFRYQF